MKKGCNRSLFYYLYYVKKTFLFLLLLIQPFIGVCQKYVDDKATFKRVEQLIDTLKEYKEVLNFISNIPNVKKYVLISSYDSVNKNNQPILGNIITIKIGYYEIEPDGFIPMYYAYYSIKDDKITRISKVD